MLEAKNLNVAYGQVTAVWDVTFTVGADEIVAIVGPNGAGKTTLINSVSGIVPLRRGTISFRGKQMNQVPAHRRVAEGLSQCPEGRKLFPEMTIDENLRLGAFLCSDRHEVKERLERVFAIFPKLEQRRGQLARTLSGGEQQMVAIGRALMQKPKMLLLDEPSLGLAPRIVGDVFKSIATIHREGVPVLIVEQNVRQTLEIAHRAYVIENGRVALEGEGRALLENEHMKRAYLGLH
ncbi:MAG: ABC transporter ATP-binding protein [Parvibaculaceae bacterium]